ncbi:PP2C family protein-serine/threonine phosphatase [Nocardioides sp. R-C-SC26]|uniref:PP2C family protein-serine/threonine phosphatase n=1 Tax=Nocardioides sp. R-C-SC26 TaxID=2870414 RepID=UPI001E4B1717|nr:PP2C family protein-serine/threonine phosphatase [Nocardioides sp. R-C-SC26]
MRRGVPWESRIAIALSVLTVVLTVMVVNLPDQFPFTSLIVPLVTGSIVLGPRTLPWFVIVVMAMLTLSLSQQTELTQRVVGAAVVQFIVALIVLLASARRARLGVAGLRGEAMFVDLRDRIQNQGGIPELPNGWTVESALQSAGGTAFAGDFLVASRASDGRHLQIVVVDVSGKGVEAGTRALLLSGAFGGILGALPAAWFLPAANSYLLRQGWEEGFATAIHLWLDLETGDFEVRAAGHPPAVRRTASSGRWDVLHTEGPILGLVDDATFTSVRGRLAPGDAVLLYTDGMVEERHRDIDLGIDRMLGEAEGQLRGSFHGSAARLARTLGSKDDDRALVVVHRD